MDMDVGRPGLQAGESLIPDLVRLNGVVRVARFAVKGSNNRLRNEDLLWDVPSRLNIYANPVLRAVRIDDFRKPVRDPNTLKLFFASQRVNILLPFVDPFQLTLSAMAISSFFLGVRQILAGIVGGWN